ncbi:MAG: CvpA family protein [Clostridia bacterium]|nr:CvpA family protein [Clostridia bacterium]
MFLDCIAVVILIAAALAGRRRGLFRVVAGLLAFVLAGVCTALFGGGIRTWAMGTEVYSDAVERFTETVQKLLESGETTLIEPFLSSGVTHNAAEAAAAGIAASLLSVLVFMGMMIVIRVGITVLDKTVFHLPLLRPVNRLFGMVISVLFTLILLYLAAGALGGLTMYTENEFLAGQMQSSVLVRYMYENNYILDIVYR